PAPSAAGSGSPRGWRARRGPRPPPPPGRVRPRRRGPTAGPATRGRSRDACSWPRPPREQQALQPGAHRLDADAPEDVGDEGADEKAPGRLLRQPPRAQVEERLLLDLADGGGVAALHVVGVDLQRRLAG